MILVLFVFFFVYLQQFCLLKTNKLGKLQNNYINIIEKLLKYDHLTLASKKFNARESSIVTKITTREAQNQH